MGRRAIGWRLRQRAPGCAYSVRFTWAGQDHEPSTGTSDPELAAREAARIYADVVSREPKPKHRTKSGARLEELIEKWLVSISATHDGYTVKTWKLYAESHWLPFFDALHHVNDAMARDYRDARLRVVLATTVRKELTALRSFVAWLADKGHLERSVVVPGVSKRSTGTRHPQRRRSAAIELSPAEAAAIIDSLPEWSTSKKVPPFPIRARFIVAYETSLRPETLDLLSCPEHYSRGRGYLDVPLELDKNRWDRAVPLTEAARVALERVCPVSGPIFGKHDYRDHMRAAAAASLPPHKAKLFTSVHLRSARITHLLEETGNLPGTQFMAGHKHTTTTARYVKPSLRAAEAMLKKLPK
jgi:integrase